MSVINYGDPEPDQNKTWESPDGTWWFYDHCGWVWSTEELCRDWEEFDETDFPMKEATV